MQDGKYTYVTDSTSTSDGAGTNVGGLSQSLNGGICGFPDKFAVSILESQREKVKAFKVGASIGYMYGDAYLKRYFPEINWKTGRRRRFSRFEKK